MNVVPRGSIVNTLSTGGMDNVRETSLAARSWNSRFLDGAVLSPRIGGRGRASRAVQPTRLC